MSRDLHVQKDGGSVRRGVCMHSPTATGSAQAYKLAETLISRSQLTAQTTAW